MAMVGQEQSLPSRSSITSVGDSSNNQIRVRKYLKRNETSGFKGVSSHYNGHWGAQIYANNGRIWLGTFKSENEAAMAYDSAAIRFRNGDSHRNFQWTRITVHEPHFQSLLDDETLLAMIKDGSYMNKFADYLNAQFQVGRALPAENPGVGFMGQELFQKELTPSDVGKLNRLVIPKKFAVRYFPSICPSKREQDGDVVPSVKDTELHFHDRFGVSWKFRYCYWKSSQSYVLTRGWNRFVKDKNLKANDMVLFSYFDNSYVIDIKYNEAAREKIDVEQASRFEEVKVKIKEENLFDEIDFFDDERVKKKPKSMRLFGKIIELD